MWMLCGRGQLVPGRMLRASASHLALLAIIVSLFGSASGLSVRMGSVVRSKLWEKRGVYGDRTDMPSVAKVSSAVGAPAPWEAPRWVWSRAWKLHKRVLPMLHRWDKATPADTCVNLIVVWLKAIAGNRRLEGTDDDGAAYAMLPHFTRRVVSWPWCYLYPRLHHANVALRTAYLDREVDRELRLAMGASTTVVVLGAGFDTRALRFGGAHRGVRWAEVDLPEVSAQKQRLLARAARRRPGLVAAGLPTFHAANLSDTASARAALCSALRADTAVSRVLFVCEALLIYIPEPQAAALIKMAVDEATAAGAKHVAFAFADKLPGMREGGSYVPGPPKALPGAARDVDSAKPAPSCAYADAARELRKAGLVLEQGTWQPKPGLARHMGVARKA